ncbi:MAG TPA: DNA recombination protein RmuC [Sphingomicrobium sp.]
MDLSLAIALAFIALVFGAALGWLIGNRSAAAATERASRAAELQKLLDAVIVERDEAMRTRATLEADARNFEARMTEIREAKEALSAQFSEIGTKLLSEAQEVFLKRADQRFKESEATSGQKLSALLQPVHERLEKYEKTVTTLEEKRSDAFGNLAGLIESMRVGQEKVSSEAAKLVNSLRNAPKSRGRWGEQQLKNVLETCGLTENCDFQTEVSVDTEEGRMRPDVIIRIPGGRTLIIDAKVSLNAYQDAFGAVDEAERLLGLGAHAASMKAHINALGNKAYQNQFGSAPDYVIMFVPGEHFLSAALEHDPTLWDFAFDKRVLLATPTNLIAIARSVASVWQQEAIAKNARAIAELGKEMYDRLAKVADDLRKVGSGLNSAVSNFNAFANSFNGRLVVTGRKFRDLDIETGMRQLEDVSPVEALARSGDVAALIESPRHDDPKGS